MFVAVSLLSASFPGEPHINLLTGNSLFSVQCDRWISQRFDRLVLPNVDVVDDEKLDRIEKAALEKYGRLSDGERTRHFRARDLSCGMFDLADFRSADFSDARMSGARFRYAALQGATLIGAILQEADLYFAQLQGAALTSAQLQGANLTYARLHGADLFSARLQGANLTDAQLQGADLGFAWLQGAILTKARLQGANLGVVQLQGANLTDAQLQGATLALAAIQGADLTNAQLQGADLTGAWLQGSKLSSGDLKLALLSDVFVWRAKPTRCADARITGLKFDEILEPAIPVQATLEVIERFIDRVVASVDSKVKKEVRDRLRMGLVADIPADELAAIEANWRDCAANSEKVAKPDYIRQHADLMRDVICNSALARNEIVAGVINNWIDTRWNSDPSRHDYASRLARGLLAPEGKPCAAAKDLTERTKSRLLEAVSTPISAN